VVARGQAIAALNDELARKPKAAPRATYTKRILDIVKNVRKQKMEIEKILADVRQLQKEINSASETLQRSFATTDEIIFRSAVKDAASKQCYKALAAMHEAFGRLVDSVHQMGACANASRDLQGQIDELNTRNVSGAIERISSDLKQVLDANAKLEGS